MFEFLFFVLNILFILKNINKILLKNFKYLTIVFEIKILFLNSINNIVKNILV